VCVLTIAVSAAAQYLSPRQRYILIGVIALLFAVSRAQNPLQFAFYFCVMPLMIGLVTALVRICAVDLITLGVALFWLQVAGPVATLLEQPAPVFRWNGVACCVVAVTVGVAVLMRFRRGSSWKEPLATATGSSAP
jgi:hypothetical protein